jgi:hypothetical protein
MVYDKQLNVFAFSTYAAFAELQSRPHEVWSFFFGSTFEDRPIYTLIDCFGAFPFSEGWEQDDTLEAAGRAYYSLRAAIMLKNKEGLTETYNRFHDPEETQPEILSLRELHAAMDGAVLNAYGWTDIKPKSEFILDYEGDDEDGAQRRAKPWRYRWPDEVRDDVLARLLELNRQRALDEGRLASSHPLSTTGKNEKKVSRKKKSGPQEDSVDQISMNLGDA